MTKLNKTVADLKIGDIAQIPLAHPRRGEPLPRVVEVITALIACVCGALVFTVRDLVTREEKHRHIAGFRPVTLVTKVTRVNVEPLARVLAHIEAHPETWHQAEWRCGSSMCFAGWTCELSGGRWVNGPNSWHSDLLFAEFAESVEGHAEFTAHEGHVVVTAHERAQRLLGLGEDQADALFSAYNTIDDLRAIVAQLTAEAAAVDDEILALAYAVGVATPPSMES